MFSIESVELENFRSYKGKHKFDVPNQPGLYLITGYNEEQPRLGSNDVGKSTLLDAIYWCFYGRTTRGLRASDVVSWGEKSCAVTVVGQVGIDKFTIARRQNPNRTTVNGVPFSPDEIEKHLRLGPEAFTYAVMLPQFGESFFDLQPAAKLTLFSQIMGLEYWLEKSEEAAELSHDIELLILENDRKISNHEGQITAITEEIKKLTRQDLNFRYDKAITLKALQQQMDTLRPPDLKAIEFIKKALVNINHKLTHVYISDKTCPECGQKLINTDRVALLQNQRDFDGQLLQHTIDQDKYNHVQAEIAKEKGRTNPYEELATASRDRLRKVEAERVRLQQDNARLQQDLLSTQFWVGGFKRLRLFIVEQTLRALEVEVNNNMAALGLTDWRIEFDVERETKSGTVTKGFVVLVYSPMHAEPVRWEAWAGGVTQRLRLAGDLGLANLIMERAGLRSTIEFYDEPSRHLSQEGLLDVAETLHQRALTDGKRIFLVDHSTIDFGDFAGRYFITKGSTGSVITSD